MALATIRPSHMEWKPIQELGIFNIQSLVDERKLLTRNTPIPSDLVTVTTTVPTSQMQGHMQVAHKMDQELKGLFRDGITFRSSGFNPLGQQSSSVPNTAQHVDPFVAVPALGSREQALLRRVIPVAADVMERSGPTHTIPELVGPRRNV